MTRSVRAHDVETGKEAWAFKGAHDEAVNAMYVHMSNAAARMLCPRCVESDLFIISTQALLRPGGAARHGRRRRGGEALGLPCAAHQGLLDDQEERGLHLGPPEPRGVCMWMI